MPPPNQDAPALGATTPCALRCDNLTLGYDEHPAVHHLSCDIVHGSLTAIVGPNGGGKSTLLRGLTGMLAPLGGSVTQPTPGSIAYLPQQAEIDRSFPMTVFDLVAMGLWSDIGAFGRLTRAHRTRVQAALERVGLTGFDQRGLAALSGGQVQRVLFARLILQNAQVMLLDEPFAAVDARTTQDLLTLITQWQTEGRTIVAVLHDMSQVRRHFPDCLILAREKIAHGPTAQVLTPDALSRANAMTEAPDPHAPLCDDVA
ncbi:MAG: zinc ABC transporter ATP-binding protein AztA [Primorskyibacter sp.]